MTVSTQLYETPTCPTFEVLLLFETTRSGSCWTETEFEQTLLALLVSPVAVAIEHAPPLLGLRSDAVTAVGVVGIVTDMVAPAGMVIVLPAVHARSKPVIAQLRTPEEMPVVVVEMAPYVAPESGRLSVMTVVPVAKVAAAVPLLVAAIVQLNNPPTPAIPVAVSLVFEIERSGIARVK